MGGEELRISSKFYRELKGAVADDAVSGQEKDRLQKLADADNSPDERALVAFLADSSHVRLVHQATAASDVPASLDIPAEDGELHVTVKSQAEELSDQADAQLRLADQAADRKDKQQAKARLEQARALFQQAAQLEPTNFGIHRSLGAIHYRLGQVDESIAQFRRAQELDPEGRYPDVPLHLGQAYARKGQNDEALAQFRRVAELDRVGRYRQELAAQLKNLSKQEFNGVWQESDPQRKQTRIDRAIALYELLKQVAPEDGGTTDFRLGELHYMAAIHTYNLAQDPHTPEEKHALLDKVRAHKAAAEQSFQAAIAAEPRQANAYFYLGKLHNIFNEAPLAGSELAQAVKLLPNDPEVHAELAKNHALRRDWPEAQKSYDQAIQLLTQQLDAAGKQAQANPGSAQMQAQVTQLKKQLAGLLVDQSGVYGNKANAASEVYPEDFAKSEELNRKALQLDPQNDLARRNLNFLQSMKDPTRIFEEFSVRYLKNKSAGPYHAVSLYGALAMAAQEPNATRERKQAWAELKANIDGIKTDMDFIPISYLNTKEGKVYHIPLTGGRTATGQYRVVDPMTNRCYEGRDKADAMQHFLDENKYPEGRLRYTKADGTLMEKQLAGEDHNLDVVATAWTVGSLLALGGSIVFPPAAPVLVPIAVSGLAPGAYFATKGGLDIADRLQHGQNVTWDMWALEATQVVGVLLGVGALASAVGGGARAAGAAAGMAGAAESSELVGGMTQAQRFVAVQRFLLCANLTNDAVAAAAMSKQLVDITGRTDISDEEKKAAIFRTLGTIILSTGMNIRNIQSLGGLRGMQRLTTLDDASFRRLMSLPEDQRQAFFGLSDEAFAGALQLSNADMQQALAITNAAERAGTLELMSRGLDLTEGRQAYKAISERAGAERAGKILKALPKDPLEAFGTLRALQEEDLAAKLGGTMDEGALVGQARNRAVLKAPTISIAELPEGAAAAILQQAVIPKAGRLPPGAAPLTKEFLAEQGLEPKHTVKMGDSKVHLSAPYDHNGQRTAVVAYIEQPDGSITIRTFYRSNSQGLWRSASHCGPKGWIGKGVGEESTNLPFVLQRELSRVADGDVKALGSEAAADTAFYGGLADGKPRQDFIDLYGYDPTPSAPKAFTDEVPGGNELVSMDPRRTVRSPKGNEHALPETLDFKYWKHPENQPDYTRPVTNYKFRHPIHGDVDAYIYNSQDGKYQYLFFKDGHNRTWLAAIETTDPGVNSFGGKREVVMSGDLTMPAVEYGGGVTGTRADADMIPKGYKGEHVNGNYWDATKYVHSLEVVSKFRAAIGLSTEPAAVPAGAH